MNIWTHLGLTAFFQENSPLKRVGFGRNRIRFCNVLKMNGSSFMIYLYAITSPNGVSSVATETQQYGLYVIHIDQNFTKIIIMVIVIIMGFISELYRAYFSGITPGIYIKVCIDIHLITESIFSSIFSSKHSNKSLKSCISHQTSWSSCARCIFWLL